MTTSELDGSRALITGAGQGIGLAIATTFAERGARVVMADVNDSVADAAATLDAAWLKCDVTVECDFEKAVAAVVERWGGIDVVVNNAGIGSSGPLVEQSAEAFDRTIAVNTRSVLFGIKHGGRAIASNGGGAIVNIASAAALRGSPLGGAYAASKAAVVSLTQTAALELRDQGVRVNAVCPGFIDTEMATQVAKEMERALGGPVAPLIDHIQQRMGQASEVAEVVAFLASPAASFVSGIALSVDNGLTSRML